MNWWNSDSSTKASGSVAGKLAAARDAAFSAELTAGSPMGKLLAAKEQAAAKAAAAGITPEAAAAAGSAAVAMMPGKAGKLVSKGQKAAGMAKSVKAGLAGGAAAK
eukprot:SAG11_NODE_2365_length_3457_cov_1.677189_2_plen_106_part_00